jgi:hypothetical protein
LHHFEENFENNSTAASATLLILFFLLLPNLQNFANMQLDEIQANITARRNKIFLLMEEVRRLRIQQRIKGGAAAEAASQALDAALLEEAYPSFIPFFPPVTPKTIKLYTNFYYLSVISIILFGGLVAPIVKLKLGLGGMSYYEFIQSVNLPTQLAEVDPIVASFCGGAVGVLTSLLVIETNNAKIQEKRKCIYCEGSGYLTCGNCLGSGVAAADGIAAAVGGSGSGDCACSFCSGTGKVMCTACLCTGKQLATEHDPRVDPFTLAE